MCVYIYIYIYTHTHTYIHTHKHFANIRQTKYISHVISKLLKSGFGGLEVTCWPLVPKFAGSNPAEAIGFFRAKKSSARLSSEGK